MEIHHTANGAVLDVSGCQVMQDGEYHRFVCHRNQIVTVGFQSEEALRRNADSFLATEQAIERCRARYQSLYPSAT